jgi:hypothetical protein
MSVRAVVVALAISFIAGCGPDIGGKKLPREAPPPVPPGAPVSGEVMMKGAPLPDIYVVAIPEKDMEKYDPFYKGGYVSGTDRDGKFTMTTKQPGDGLPVGKYILIFERELDFDEADPKDKLSRPLRAKYGDAKKNATVPELCFTVEKGKPVSLKIELKL